MAPFTDLRGDERPVESGLPEPSAGGPGVDLEAALKTPRHPDIGQIPLIKAASSREPDEWRDELSERVASFRRRRAQIRGFDPNSTLEFDFGSVEGEEADARGIAAGAKLRQAGQEEEKLGFPFGGHAELERRDLNSVPSQEERRQEHEIAFTRAGQWPRVMKSSLSSAVPIDVESELPEFSVAPLSRRFLAGLLDTLALLLVAALFVSVFFWAGGRARLRPVTFGVAAFVAGFFVLAYFGLFSALCFSTPGQAYMGLSVRSLDGSLPTPAQSFWRGFGYSVSTAAFMLGFVWALVDSDGLTWHDRMSGTSLRVETGP